MCIGFENLENNEDKHFMEALELSQKIVALVQKAGIFSPNEEIEDIDPNNLK